MKKLLFAAAFAVAAFVVTPTTPAQAMNYCWNHTISGELWCRIDIENPGGGGAGMTVYYMYDGNNWHWWY